MHAQQQENQGVQEQGGQPVGQGNQQGGQTQQGGGQQGGRPSPAKTPRPPNPPGGGRRRKSQADKNQPPPPSEPVKRAVWVRFKHGRPTELDLDEEEVHVDHLKKKLKNMFPRILSHVEVFEFSIRQTLSDMGYVPEDYPIDRLREGNRASNPLFVDAPDRKLIARVGRGMSI